MCWDGKDVLYHQQQQQGSQLRVGQGLSSSAPSNDHESSLSPEEEEYFRQYNETLAAYKGQWTDVDLTGSLEPPKDLFIDVRVLKDAGEVQTEYGFVMFFSSPRYARLTAESRAINLTKNSQFYVRYGDVERLIAQGFLQRLT
jgi:GINS complex subunit 1